MTLVLEEKLEHLRSSQMDGTGANVSPVVIINTPREGAATSSARNVNYEYSTPNETTLQTFRAIEAGDVIRCKDEKDFFEQLNAE